MLENNEASVDHSGITEDLLPVGKHLANGCSATIDVEVISVKSCQRANASLHDWSQAHGGTNSADTVINITEGRSVKYRSRKD